MSKARPYEDEILQTVRAMPPEALPRVSELIAVVRDEFRTAEKTRAGSPNTSHQRTRGLVASSRANWAQSLLAERDDRL